MKDRLHIAPPEQAGSSTLSRKVALAALVFFCGKGLLWLAAGYLFFWLN